MIVVAAVFCVLKYTQEELPMGQKDTALKQYLEDDTRFADLIKGLLGKGKKLISEDALHQQDPWVADPLLFPRSKNKKMHTGRYKKILPKYRDFVRKVAYGLQMTKKSFADMYWKIRNFRIWTMRSIM